MSGDVLERNVRALLRRSFVPALPAPHYRDRLESLFLTEVERRSSGRPSLARAARRRWPALFALAAAAVLALVFGWRGFGWRALVPAEPRTRDELLARGRIALGFADGTWRAASEEERRLGILLAAPWLAAATPAEALAEVRVAAGVLHLRERSEVEFERRAAGEFAELQRGSAWFESGARHLELEAGRALELAAEPAPQPLVVADEPRLPAREAQPPATPKDVPSVAPAKRALTGIVVEASGDASIEAFTIGLLAERLGNETPPPVRRSFTSADGTFRWENPPAGKQRVFVYADGFALAALGEFDLSAELPTLRAELDPGEGLRGSVLDAEGNPVAGALVISERDAPTDGLLFHDSERAFWLPVQSRTGSDGRFELAHLTLGRHSLRAVAPGYAPGWLDDVDVQLAAPRAEEITLRLSAGGTVAGRVTGADGGPRANVQLVIVAMNQAQRSLTSFALARTDADGSYRSEHLPPTTLVVVLLDSARPEVKPVEVREGGITRADFGKPTSGIRLFGRLLGPDGKPVADQNLGLFDRRTASWNRNWVASTTQRDGDYSFEGLAPASYLFFLIDEAGHGLRCVDEIELRAGALEVQHEVHMPGATLAVRVAEQRSGAPVEKASLILYRTDERSGTVFSGLGDTDASGRFSFVNLPAGTYFVVAHPALAGLGLGFAEGEPRSLAQDATEEVEILLGEGGAVDVLVRDPAGRALEGAIVLFLDEQGGEHLFGSMPYTDANGRFRASGVSPGSYRVVARLPGYQAAPVPFRFDLGQELEVPIVLAPEPARGSRPR